MGTGWTPFPGHPGALMGKFTHGLQGGVCTPQTCQGCLGLAWKVFSSLEVSEACLKVGWCKMHHFGGFTHNLQFLKPGRYQRVCRDQEQYQALAVATNLGKEIREPFPDKSCHVPQWLSGQAAPWRGPSPWDSARTPKRSSPADLATILA